MKVEQMGIITEDLRRQVTDEEIKLARRVVGISHEQLNAIDNGVVYYRTQGNFTICFLAIMGHEWFAGVTKRAPRDVDRPEHARRIAFRRAVENAIELSA